MFTTTISFMYPDDLEEVWKDVSSYDITGTRLKQTVSQMIKSDNKVLDNIIKSIEDAPTYSVRIQVLSLICYDYTKEQLCKMSPVIYKSLVDAAREHATREGPGAPREAPEITRERLDETKVEHFFEFITHPDFIQDVAYGTQTITVDGDEEKIPSLIRTIVNGRLIKVYLEHCKRIKYKALSESVLYKLLSECCPAKQSKSLSGLDNTAAAGENSITALTDILRSLKPVCQDHDKRAEIDKDIIALQEACVYLKQELKSHISLDNECGDHCLKWALSDQKQKKFQSKCSHKHTLQCEKCSYINSLNNKLIAHLDSMKDSLGEIYDEHLLDIRVNVKNIQEWKAHILRTLNQNRCKDGILQNLKKNQVLFIIDYPMKYLPRKFREPQESYFGKPGLSWHVSVAILRDDDDNFSVNSYVTMLNRAPQDSYAVISILKHMLQHFHKENPRINEGFIRSDNAGYYHCVDTITALCTDFGVKIKRYDFSEAQSGKDICDRKTASMKSHINNYCHAGNNVEDAVQMMNALLSYGGVKGTSVSVMAPNYAFKAKQSAAITAPGVSISAINNVEYTRNGLKVHRAFGMGSGILIKKSQIENKPPMPVIDEIAAFTQVGEKGHMKSKNSDNDESESEESESDESQDETEAEGAGKLFQCPQCSKSYRYQHFLDRHIITGKHIKPKTNVYDKVKRKWVAFAQGKEIKPSEIRRSNSNQRGKESANKVAMGWALKVHTKSKPHSKAVKAHLRKLYDLGEKSKNKLSAEEAERIVRHARTPDGKRMFDPSEWLTAKQIKNLFSRYTAQKTLKLASVDDVPEEYGEDDIVADLARAAINNFTNQ